ncbi:MAG TPA: hypothetical protein VMC62_05315, partial [Longilinea sp.]|nr:hypothetical protein [Longilinea sp.]
MVFGYDMSMYTVCVVGGWCGNRMVIVADHLAEVFDRAGYPCKVSHFSVWENLSSAPRGDLILQLLPAYTAEETGCPVINIKPLLLDLDHAPTIEKILDHLRDHYPVTSDQGNATVSIIV